MFNAYKGGRLDFKLFGVSEGDLRTAADKLSEKYDGLKANFSVKYGDALFSLFCENAELLEGASRAFMNTFDSYIYANENYGLAELAVQLLKLSGKKLRVAESFTGGRIAHAIVSVKGASEVFYSGLVCYDTDCKIRELGVSPETVRVKSVVSREVAYEMVRGQLLGGNCDIALSSTGYASPTGDPDRPSGLCYIGAGEEDKVEVNRYVFGGDRAAVIEQGKNAALFMLCRLLRRGSAFVGILR